MKPPVVARLDYSAPGTTGGRKYASAPIPGLRGAREAAEEALHHFRYSGVYDKCTLVRLAIVRMGEYHPTGDNDVVLEVLDPDKVEANRLRKWKRARAGR